MKTLKTLMILLFAVSSMHVFAENEGAVAGVGENSEACGSGSDCGQCIDSSSRGNSDESTTTGTGAEGESGQAK